MRLALALLLLTLPAQAQWQLQQSNTTADLRGIHSIGNGIAWASGSKGTVLRTTDNGTTWQPCTIPPGAEALDFRGIQAFDAQTAIVMSSGKGDLSRLYKTSDACKTWKLVFTNPDAEGFWDAFFCGEAGEGWLLGDPVAGEFRVWQTQTKGDTWSRSTALGLDAASGEAAFAASNSLFYGDGSHGLRIGFFSGGIPNARCSCKRRLAELFISELCQLRMGVIQQAFFRHNFVCVLFTRVQAAESSSEVITGSPTSAMELRPIAWTMATSGMSPDLYPAAIAPPWTISI